MFTKKSLVTLQSFSMKKKSSNPTYTKVFNYILTYSQVNIFKNLLCLRNIQTNMLTSV